MTHHDTHEAGADQETTGRTVVGLFRGRSDAEAAIRDLKDAGFSDDRIGVAVQDQGEQRDLVESTGGTPAEGAATGALSGATVGGLIGLLGSLLIPGVGPIVVGGVLASALTGAGIGAAAGGIIGALAGMGVPELDAKHFDLGLRSGGTLVTVDAGARTAEALALLERHGMDFGPSGRDRYGSFDRATGAAGSPVISGLDVGTVGAIDDGVGGIGMGDVASGSSTGTRGFPSSREPYRGRERRVARDSTYAGPERRLVGT